MIALAHHWLVTHRGGERVLAEFRRLFPEAPIATLVCKRGEIPDWIIGPKVIPSPLQYIPGAAKYYKALLPLHPWAFGQLKVPTETRFVLSSEAAMVKGLQVPMGAAHLCYCNSPPRYLWEMQEEYIKNSGGLGWLGKTVFKLSTPYAKRFDYAAAQRVDRFIGNSQFIAERIQRCYNRPADVIYPPVSVDDFSPDKPSEDFYLLVTQLTPYKRADLAVDAFNQSGRRLVIIGEGSELEPLRQRAKSNIELIGKQPFRVVKDFFERCRGFLYPQIEDFGITALEAQAAGKPVVAFRAGGAKETVIENQTGVFFDEQTAEALNDAVTRLENITVNWVSACRANAEKYRPERFRAEVKAYLEKYFPQIFSGYPWPV